MTFSAFLRSRPRWQLALGGIALLWLLWTVVRPSKAASDNLTVVAKRGPKSRGQSMCVGTGRSATAAIQVGWRGTSVLPIGRLASM